MSFVVIIATVVVFAVAITAMAVGVMAGRKPIAGSCGGIATLRQGGAVGVDGPVCEFCGAKPDEACGRDEERAD
jgi:hypothetical protein